MSDVMTIRVDRRTRSCLEKLAKPLDRSRSSIAGEAIRAHLDLHEWQVAEIKVALREADSGEFASEAEVRAVVKKWGRGAR